MDCAQDDATFEINKDFSDNNTAEVEVTLDCFTGLPITQSQSISESQNVVLTVQSFNQGELNCNITETATTGYTGSYNDGTASNVNCSYEDLFGGNYVCNITNTPDNVEIWVNKDWVMDGDGGTGGDFIDANYRLDLYCDNPIVENGAYWTGSQYHWNMYNGDSNGTNDVHYGATVTPDWAGGTHCSVSETVYESAVEVSNHCSSLLVEIAGGDECTITNTVFFEGIPSLNQYGLAILALLMLGMGFVGFRRFA